MGATTVSRWVHRQQVRETQDTGGRNEGEEKSIHAMVHLPYYSNPRLSPSQRAALSKIVAQPGLVATPGCNGHVVRPSAFIHW